MSNHELLLVHHLRVETANTISSPITYGLPAVTHFMGFSHRVQRLVRERTGVNDWTIHGVGIICHRIHVLAEYFGGGKNRFKLTGNPLTRQGNRPSFVEEGRCHLDVSLVLQCDPVWDQTATQTIADLIFAKTRLAGGTIVYPPKVLSVPDEPRVLRRLIPGWVLMERRDLLAEDMAAGKPVMDALHDRLAVTFRPVHDESDDASSGRTRWEGRRMQNGVIVPVAVGYQAISPEIPSTNARDRETPHRFAESVVTLGEFVMPGRLQSPTDMLWRYHHDGDLYVCQQLPIGDSSPDPITK